MIYEHDNLISFLKGTLEAKAKTNASYSMRAFAKKIGLSPGTLSLILNGKKKLSTERSHEVAQALELSHEETEYLVTLVQLENAKSPTLKMQFLERAMALNPKIGKAQDMKKTLLSFDHFKLISDWYGLAVLELVTCAKGEWTPATISKKLGLSKMEVELTLERLLKLELIEALPSGGYSRVAGTVMIHSNVPVEAMRNHYTQLHQKSLESLTNQPASVKAIGCEVFAFDPDQLGEVRDLTNNFLDQLNELSQKGKNRTEVYQALTNVFKLSK